MSELLSIVCSLHVFCGERGEHHSDCHPNKNEIEMWYDEFIHEISGNGQQE